MEEVKWVKESEGKGWRGVCTEVRAFEADLSPPSEGLHR